MLGPDSALLLRRHPLQPHAEGDAGVDRPAGLAREWLHAHQQPRPPSHGPTDAPTTPTGLTYVPMPPYRICTCMRIRPHIVMLELPRAQGIVSQDASTPYSTLVATATHTPHQVFDSVNNVEQAMVFEPAIGTWTALVHGHSVDDQISVNGQNWALVVSGGVTDATAGCPARCPHACSGFGTCSNGVCTCNTGRFGVDCSLSAFSTACGARFVCCVVLCRVVLCCVLCIVVCVIRVSHLSSRVPQQLRGGRRFGQRHLQRAHQ